MKPASQQFDPNGVDYSLCCDGQRGRWPGRIFSKVQRSPSADLFLVTVTAGIMSEGARVDWLLGESVPGGE